jgi:hypothetical protein
MLGLGISWNFHQRFLQPEAVSSSFLVKDLLLFEGAGGGIRKDDPAGFFLPVKGNHGGYPRIGPV